MTLPAYHLTETALSQFETVIRETAYRWGWRQAETYRDALLEGFQEIAVGHPTLHSPHRAALASGTGFSLHLVEHHYVCFTLHDKATVIVAGLFHEAMNIPARLNELRTMSTDEIAALQDAIDREAARRRADG